MPAAVLCDLDGVVWLARQALPGAPEAVSALRVAGVRVVFVTNNSAAPLAEQEAALDAIGIPARGDVITSAIAAAHLIAPGERVMVCGGPGVAEAVTRRGAQPVAGDDDTGGPVDAVVVGFHTDFDYTRLRIAATAVLAGARLIGTNDDPTYPTPAGPIRWRFHTGRGGHGLRGGPDDRRQAVRPDGRHRARRVGRARSDDAADGR